MSHWHVRRSNVHTYVEIAAFRKNSWRGFPTRVVHEEHGFENRATRYIEGLNVIRTAIADRRPSPYASALPMTTASVSTIAANSKREADKCSSLVHGGGSIRRYCAQQFQGAVFPLAAGVLLYGWRALVVAIVVVGSTAGATLVWKQLGRRGRDLSLSHACWLALLLALALPAHLASFAGIQTLEAPFWILPAAGVLLAIVLWILRGVAGTALHPVVVTYLVLVPFFEHTLAPRYVLQRDHLFSGDVLDAPSHAPAAGIPWWFTGSQTGAHAAVHTSAPASESLLNYTLGRRDMTDRGTLQLQSLLRDRLPPLEDLVMAGAPGPIGASSVIFVIVGGLFLMYRGVIDYRIPLVFVTVAFVAMLVLPIPVSITEIGARRAWFAVRDPSVGWAVGITFVNYQLAASPALFMAFFLATSPTVRPMAGRGRVLFAAILGLLTAVLQLYVSVSWGPYAALLVAGLFTPLADRFFSPRPLAV